ncbi:hypothetical protein HN51_005473, partial [Arachis hypogaea]
DPTYHWIDKKHFSNAADNNSLNLLCYICEIARVNAQNIMSSSRISIPPTHKMLKIGREVKDAMLEYWVWFVTSFLTTI